LEPHGGSVSARLGWLRAAVLGANDGIVSTAGLVVGVAAATTDAGTIATAGGAGLVAGAVSMALGEYVSVSSQRDAERAMVRQEADELRRLPELERRELIGMLTDRGLSPETSAIAADELTAHDALATHLELELGIDREQLADPWAAAGSSALAFTIGALLPLVAILLPPSGVRIPVAVAAVLVALAGTGHLSARLGGAPPVRAVVRLVGGGAAALAITYGIGEVLGTAVA
jgi:VIT1/CCC1 family predicted Fe2+/Mn2+ transporter